MVYGNHGSDEADKNNCTDGILELTGTVTTDLTFFAKEIKSRTLFFIFQIKMEPLN